MNLKTNKIENKKFMDLGQNLPYSYFINCYNN
jgi:hypothetical protein